MDKESSVIGTKRISWNDGNGNFNFRLNCTGEQDYLVTNDGACHIAMNAETASGTINLKVASQGTDPETQLVSENIYLKPLDLHHQEESLQISVDLNLVKVTYLLWLVAIVIIVKL